MAFRMNLPPVTRAFLVSLLVLSLLYNIGRWRQISAGDTPETDPIVPYLTLVPAGFLFYPWTLFTATFVEQNIFTVLLNSATLLYGGKYLERAWGSSEFGKFILIVSLIPNVITVPVYIIWAAVSGNSDRGYVFIPMASLAFLPSFLLTLCFTYQV